MSDFPAELYRVYNAINHAAFILREAGITDGRREAETLAQWVLGVDNLVFAPRVFSHSDLDDFFVAVGARARHIPLQHVTSTMHFRYMELESRPGVFVVRPETEYMVEEALTDLPTADPSRTEPVRVVDLCTGSGAIALAMASEYPAVAALGVDISQQACDLALANRDRVSGANNIDTTDNYLADGSSTVEFCHGDIRDPKLIERLATTQWDIVISNPPYVPAGDVEQAEALHDPNIALYGGGLDGMAMPKRVIDIAVDVLRPGGRFYMEHAPQQAQPLAHYATKQGLSDVVTNRDLTGRLRWISATKPKASL